MSYMAPYFATKRSSWTDPLRLDGEAIAIGGLAGVDLLEPRRAQVAERRVQPPSVVRLIEMERGRRATTP